MTRLRRDLFGDRTVAHASLRGQVPAQRFSEGRMMRVTVPVADLRLSDDPARIDRQVLQGHRVCLLDGADGLGRDEGTGYVGRIAPGALANWVAPTHRVRVARSLIFAAPDMKTADPVPVSCGALLTVTAVQGRFARLDDERHAIADHLEPAGHVVRDWVARAEALAGTPYLWGGNSAFGIDCSGLVQLALQAAGQPCPGDSDQQEQALGAPVPQGGAVRRGDLFFWKGHVAIAADTDRLIHANALHMAVAFEPLGEAIARIARQGDGPVTAHKRLTLQSGDPFGVT